MIIRQEFELFFGHTDGCTARRTEGRTEEGQTDVEVEIVIQITTFEFLIPAVVSQNVTNKSCLVCVISEKYASWVTLRPQSDCCRKSEAKVRILDFKTTWLEFQRQIRLLLSKAKLSYVYSILKPHGQSSRSPVRLLLSEAKPSYIYLIVDIVKVEALARQKISNAIF